MDVGIVGGAIDALIQYGRDSTVKELRSERRRMEDELDEGHPDLYNLDLWTNAAGKMSVESSFSSIDEDGVPEFNIEVECGGRRYLIEISEIE